MPNPKEQAIIDELTKVIKKYCDDICDYCKNHIPCEGKKCSEYIEGIGDADGKYPDFKWTCEDFDYGTCFKLENTPCNGCYDDYNGFKWKGLGGK